MIKEIVDLTKKLVSYKTTPDNKKNLDLSLNFLKNILSDFHIKTYNKNGVKSLLVYNKKPKNNKFKIILNGHLDIIPGKNRQYQPKIIGNKLFAAGSLDMKGGLSAIIYAFKEVANTVNYPLALQITTDEETGGFFGTKYQIKKGVKADFVITSEPTNLDIVYKAKGILWLKIKFSGKSFHSAYPWNGENAIEKANIFINNVRKIIKNPKSNQWETTINYAHINSPNKVFNKIPDKCELMVDIRYIPEENNILEKIKELLDKNSKIEVEVNEKPFLVNKNNAYILEIKKLTRKILDRKVVLRGANGSSDARHYAYMNTPAIEFGPEGAGIGSDDEYVCINSLEQYFNILKKFLLNIQ